MLRSLTPTGSAEMRFPAWIHEFWGRRGPIPEMKVLGTKAKANYHSFPWLGYRHQIVS